MYYWLGSDSTVIQGLYNGDTGFIYIGHIQGCMPFETYDKGSSKSSGRSTNKPQLSLRKSGTVGFNNAARREYLEGYDWALMKYDKHNELIGIELYEEEVESAYKIRKPDNDNWGAQVNCKGYTGEYGLRPEKTTRYEIGQADKGDMLVVDLNEDEIKTVEG